MRDAHPAPAWPRLGLVLAALLALAPAPAAADQVAARICAGEMATQAKNERWRLDLMQAWDIELGSSRYLLLPLQSDIEYRLVVCGDGRAQAISVVVYDAQGQLVQQASSETRAADVLIPAETTGEYFAGVRLDQVVPGTTAGEEGSSRRERRRARKQQGDTPALPVASVSVALLYR